MVMYDPDPNPKNEEQAIARSHRIGQTREVRVFHMEAVADPPARYGQVRVWGAYVRATAPRKQVINQYTRLHHVAGCFQGLVWGDNREPSTLFLAMPGQTPRVWAPPSPPLALCIKYRNRAWSAGLPSALPSDPACYNASCFT